MCGRYTLQIPAGLQARFQLDDPLPESVGSRFNVAPSQQLPVVTRNSPNHLTIMRWGLIPFYSKDNKILINARAETVNTSPAFRQAFARRRCLVPASGFYEWQKRPDGKQPMYFKLKDEEIFAFAGIYELKRDEQGQEYGTYAIITTTANNLMEPVHNRMPVILRQADEDLWLDHATTPETLLFLLQPYPDAAMLAYPVSKRVNIVANDDHSLINSL